MRDEIHGEVCEQGFDAERNTFTQSYGSKRARREPADDPARRLPAGRRPARGRDGRGDRARARARRLRLPLPHDEKARASTGCRPARAPSSPARSGSPTTSRCRGGTTRPRSSSSGCSRSATTSACSPRSTTRSQRRQLGNFPQAFSHVALVNTAFNLDRAAERGSPIEQRAPAENLRRLKSCIRRHLRCTIRPPLVILFEGYMRRRSRPACAVLAIAAIVVVNAPPRQEADLGPIATSSSSRTRSTRTPLRISKRACTAHAWISSRPPRSRATAAVIPNDRVAALRADRERRVRRARRRSRLTAAQTLPWGIDKIDADRQLDAGRQRLGCGHQRRRLRHRHRRRRLASRPQRRRPVQPVRQRPAAAIATDTARTSPARSPPGTTPPTSSGVAPGVRRSRGQGAQLQRGSGSWSDVIAGIDWVTATTTARGRQHEPRRPREPGDRRRRAGRRRERRVLRARRRQRRRERLHALARCAREPRPAS